MLSSSNQFEEDAEPPCEEVVWGLGRTPADGWGNWGCRERGRSVLEWRRNGFVESEFETRWRAQ
jgi:hypothetical protein